MSEQEYFTLYQQGFNEGYLIAQHLRELSKSLFGLKNDTPRISGMQDGYKQWLSERGAEQRAKNKAYRDGFKKRKPADDKEGDVERDR